MTWKQDQRRADLEAEAKNIERELRALRMAKDSLTAKYPFGYGGRETVGATMPAHAAEQFNQISARRASLRSGWMRLNVRSAPSRRWATVVADRFSSTPRVGL